MKGLRARDGEYLSARRALSKTINHDEKAPHQRGFFIVLLSTYFRFSKNSLSP